VTTRARRQSLITPLHDAQKTHYFCDLLQLLEFVHYD
jgi:hypothetical protein